MRGETEAMIELLTEAASDLMFVAIPKAEGLATGVKLRCETRGAEYVTKWSQENASENAEIVNRTWQATDHARWKQS